MPDVRMNYDSMQAMADAFKKAHFQLGENTKDIVSTLTQLLEDGALNGMAGDAFVDALRNKFQKRLKVLAEKMKELEGDINGAVSATRDGVSTAQSRFK